MSNRYNKPRQIQKRPHICRNRGRIPEPTITCNITPESQTIVEEETADVQLIANNRDIVGESTVEVFYDTTGPTFSGPDEIEIRQQTEAIVAADVEPGDYTITATFIFADGSRCLSSADISIVPT